MVQFTKANFEKITSMVLVYLKTLDTNMMASGRRVKSMVKESILSKMEVDMKESIIKIKNMVKEFTFQIMEKLSEANGLKVNSLKLNLTNFIIFIRFL
jgi:hypothetical protein